MKPSMEQPSKAALYRAFCVNCSWGDDLPNVSIRTISLQKMHNHNVRDTDPDKFMGQQK